MASIRGTLSLGACSREPDSGKRVARSRWSRSSRHSTAGVSSRSRSLAPSAGLNRDMGTGSTRTTGILRSTVGGWLSRHELSTGDVLKAYRMIGGYDGIQFSELSAFVRKVKDMHMRHTLQKNLPDMFARVDDDQDGSIDVMGFMNMIRHSTLLQNAVYEILVAADDDEQYDNMEQTQLDATAKLDRLAVAIILLNLVSLSVQMDVPGTWIGWQILEFGFLCFYSTELALRFYWSNIGPCKVCGASDTLRYFMVLMTMLDVFIVIIGWFDMYATLTNSVIEPESDAKTAFELSDWVRVLRLTRWVRSLRIWWYCEQLRSLTASIMASMKVALGGLGLVGLIVCMWSVVIRTVVTHKWTSDNAGMEEVFPSMPDCMLVVCRCMMLNGADGALIGTGARYGSVYNLLSDQLGRVFRILWLASEIFVFHGILNSVLALFIVQAGEASSKVRDSLKELHSAENKIHLKQLDKLLRSLVHPSREEANPKDRNVAKVAKIIRTCHPDVAARVPELESQLVHLAKSFQDARKIHQNAMDVYEAHEVVACNKLREIPSATTYVVDGTEEFLASKDEDLDNSLDLDLAPMGAVEIAPEQDVTNLQDLLEDALEAQQFVKTVIFPGSDWAREVNAGSSGSIWKHSKGLCDEAKDPGPKSEQRAAQKVFLKYGGRYERNRDYARLALIYDSVDHLIQAVPRFLAHELDPDGLKVMSLENRFVNPHPMGWRDMTMLLKVRTPSWDDCKYHVMEIQLRLRGLEEVNHRGHEFYEQIRGSLPDHVLPIVVDRLVTNDILDLAISKSEWLQCVRNKEVKRILTLLGVPLTKQRDLFELIDTDESGTVASSELQNILRLWNSPLQPAEISGCYRRVRDIQQRISASIEPQLRLIHSLAMRNRKDTKRSKHGRTTGMQNVDSSSAANERDEQFLVLL